MEGRGVTNFSADKPSHGYTTSTTEFDDQLIQRGIVTTEQVMMAKGASVEEAIRLTEEKKRGGVDTVVKKHWNDRGESTTSDANESDDDDDDDDSFEDDFDDDDAFLQRYRQQRLDQLKQEQETKKASELSHSQPSSILHIGRDEWTEQVNEASFHRWVVITMTEASGERRDRVVQELHRFAREFESSSNSGADDSDSDDDDSLDGQRHPQHPARTSKPKLLTINASDAIPNWPAERVPAMFAYRDGVKQQEWIAGRRGEFPPKNILEQLFRKWNVI